MVVEWVGTPNELPSNFATDWKKYLQTKLEYFLKIFFYEIPFNVHEGNKKLFIEREHTCRIETSSCPNVSATTKSKEWPIGPRSFSFTSSIAIEMAPVLYKTNKIILTEYVYFCEIVTSIFELHNCLFAIANYFIKWVQRQVLLPLILLRQFDLSVRIYKCTFDGFSII